MNSNLFGLYAQVGAQVGALAKNNAETAAARSARIAGLVQDGARRWFDGVTASVGETARIVQDFGKARSPADIAELQRAWFQAASARATENVRTFVELSQKLAAEVSAPAAEAQTFVYKVEAPKAVAPKAEAKPAVKAEAKVEAPVAIAAPAPKAEVKKPAKTAAKPAKQAAPKAEAKAAPAAKVEAPAAAPAPAAEAPKGEAPKAEAPKTEVKPAAATPVAAPVAEAPKVDAPKAEAPKAEAKPAAKPAVAAE